MDFAAGDGVDAGNKGWWTVESALSPLSPSHISSKDTGIGSAELVHSILVGIAANMSSGFLLLNARERVTYFNASAVRLLGIKNRELIEQPIFDVRKHLLSLAAEPEEVRAEFDCAWFSPQQESSTDIALADAALRWLRIHCFPMWDARGQLLGRGILLDDITLEHTSIESHSETLTLAAHELKTPLAIIKGCATTLLGNSMRWDPTIQREMLQMIDTQADRLYDVLNTLLDVWRLDSGVQTLRLAQAHLPELLYQLVERWQKNAPRHSFALNIPASVPIVVCDAVRLERALNSLFNNAVTYSPAGGSITIQLESNDVEICLSITDQGTGIAPEHLERIFDRFYRVQQGEENSSGSGLGLAVARATFEAHGGKIWADSPGPGQGATFYCTLPFTPRLSSIAQSIPSAPPTSSVSGPLAIPSTRFTGPLKTS